MRYFLSSTLTIPSLTFGIFEFTSSCRLILFSGSLDTGSPRFFGAARLAILISPITLTADNHQGGTTGTVVESGTCHRQKKADEGWLVTPIRATLTRRASARGLCGIASTETVKSGRRYAVSLRPSFLTGFLSYCHFRSWECL